MATTKKNAAKKSNPKRKATRAPRRATAKKRCNSCR
ncbi:MAG: hypothetical protein JWO53_401 [Chlamydiia bacterium]|nr:hypothetical protein [Chlamydiia bacterium]